MTQPLAVGRTPRRALRRTAWHAGALLLLVVILYPVAWVVGASFKEGDAIVGSLQLFPDHPILTNYRHLADGIGGTSVWSFFRNSLILAAGSVVGVLVSCSLAAYAFARIRFAGRGLLFTTMIATLLLPQHVLIIPQYILFRKLGLIDTYLPLLLGKFLAVDAFFVFLMTQFMRGLPRELDEAARLDGCGHARTYWSIVLPLCRPVLTTSAIFAFIWSWNDFLGPLLYLSDPGKYPLSLGLKLFIDQDSAADYGGMVAMSLVALVPVVLFFLAFQRHLVEGAATSGLKG